MAIYAALTAAMTEALEKLTAIVKASASA